MITDISNNPFSILGLPANATRVEIDQCHNELIEGLKQQGQSYESLEEIDKAYQAVISPIHHWHHASFWFVCVSDKDRHALQYVEEGLYEKAIEMWEEKLNYASLHNMMLCYVLMGEDEIHNYAKAFYYARCLFLGGSNFELFTDCVGESGKEAVDEAKIFLDVVFSQTTAKKSTLYALLGNKEWMDYVRGKWVDADEADAGAENMRNIINMAEHAKQAEKAERSKKSYFWWIWTLLFPVYLYFNHCYQNSHKPKPFESPTETIQNHLDSLQRVREKMLDTAHIKRELRKIDEKHEAEYHSLKEKIEERKKRLKE
ncbi:MAG: hypothetical protein IKX22_09100 [Prevotella sp.]|nr:hypothetical protein [Prevotella sp.]